MLSWIVPIVFVGGALLLSSRSSDSSTGSTDTLTTNTLNQTEEDPFWVKWQQEAPAPYNTQYETFFSSTPTQEIYNNQLTTLRTLLSALSGSGVSISFVQNAYRDPDRNRQVGGDIGSYHMQGKAVDFHTNPSLDSLGESGMETLGKRVNQYGLKIIFYPFKSGDHAVHVQLSEAAKTSRRLTYETASGKTYLDSYSQARIS